MNNFYTLILAAWCRASVSFRHMNLGLIYVRSSGRRRYAIVGSPYGGIDYPVGDPFAVTIPIYMLREISAFVVKYDPGRR